MTQKWTFTDVDGSEVEVPLEQWMWGVVYRPTPEAIAAAEKATIERDDRITVDRETKIRELVKRGADEDKIMRVKEEAANAMMFPIEPEVEELHQFDAQGRFHRFHEIDQERVALFVLYKPQTEEQVKAEGQRRIDIVIPEGKDLKLIHKYRNFIFHAGTPFESRHRVYVIGYKVKGQQPHYNYVMPNGTVVQCYGDQEPKLSLMGL
jgi:hypothetical protein